VNDAAAEVTVPPVPVPDVVTAGFWEAAAGGTFVMARCSECRRWDHPPQERCRHCDGEMGFEPVVGTGTVFSFIVVRRQFVPGHPPPEVVGLIELDDQPGLRLTAVIDAAPELVEVGASVRARLAPVGATGFSAPRFALV
jgi:uncharacterized OB-fold protein